MKPIRHEVGVCLRDRNYYRHVWTQGNAIYEWVSQMLVPPDWARDEAYRALAAKQENESEYERGRADAERMYRADIETHKEALRHALKREQDARKRYELMLEQMTKVAAMQMQPVYLVEPTLAGNLKITPTKKETTLEHKTLSKLDEVKEYTLKVERQLADAKKELAQERGIRRTPDRALYVNRDGSTKVEEAKIEPRWDKQGAAGPAYEINVIEPALVPGSWMYVDNPVTFNPTWNKRRYRHAFSQGSLHVYREIG